MATMTELVGHYLGRSLSPRPRLPLTSELPDQLDDWPDEWREAYEERAGVMEFDGGLSREDAESAVENSMRERFRDQGE